MLYLQPKKLKISSGDDAEVMLHRNDAEHFGIHAGDKIQLSWNHSNIYTIANLTSTQVHEGQIGLFSEVWQHHPIANKGELIRVELVGKSLAIQSINKKLLGKRLNEKEIRTIVADIVSDRLTRVETTYFVASSFVRPYSEQELIYLVKAIAETGDMLQKPKNRLVVDKHSIGGLPGNRTTMIVIPIIASLGLYIPKTSSRAITSPSGTADTMEVLAPVTHGIKRMESILAKANGCLIWGGGLNFAPADDKIIRVSKPLSLEPYDKMLVSILAKKLAERVQYLLIDMPYGPTTKVPDLKTAKDLEQKFMRLSKKFGIVTEVVKSRALEPVGRGVGPALEARDVMRILQQKDKRPPDLEKKSLHLAGRLLEMCGFCKKGQGEAVALRQLESGAALETMQKIMQLQGSVNPKVDSDALTVGAKMFRVFSQTNGVIRSVDSTAITDIARACGAPFEKLGGVHIHARYGQRVTAGVQLYTLYAGSHERLRLAKKVAEARPIFDIR